MRYPCYGEVPPAPGLWLGLFHGRSAPDEPLEDWGFNGPLIGPLHYVHATYAYRIKLGFVARCFAHRYGFDPDVGPAELAIVGDCVQFAGAYYGDWSAFVHTAG